MCVVKETERISETEARNGGKKTLREENIAPPPRLCLVFQLHFENEHRDVW